LKSSRPSDTAKLIARSILLASREPTLRALVAGGEADILRRILNSGESRDRLLPFLELGAARWTFRRVEDLLLPGIIAHYLVRKREIEAAVEHAVANGCQQVVVLGAGYDTLSWRLHKKHPAVRFIELDHPATQQVKREALPGATNLSFHPIDLVSDLPSAVLDSTVSGETPKTAFVLEGLLMYLSQERVADLMKDLIDGSSAESTIIFTFMECDENGSIGFRGGNRLIDHWLQARGEPFRWGVPREELAAFLTMQSMKLVDLIDHEVLRRRHLSSREMDHLPLAEGELIGIATPLAV